MRRLKHHFFYPKPLSFWLAIALIGLSVNLACSAGSLLVQAPTPTATRLKTPKPTFTPTPFRTPTFTPTPTFTSTPTETPLPTQTPLPTDTPEDDEAAEPESAPAAPPPPPAEPTATSTPEAPTPTPEPEFPFSVTYFTHDTGSPGETRMTAWIRRDSGPGIFKTLEGLQLNVTAPDGSTHLSELSGPGTADSTMPGTGDNHRMNTKVEIRPYVAGEYTVFLEEGGVQVSPATKVNFSANPLQYVHFEFVVTETD
jgi:hypothetical protein